MIVRTGWTVPRSPEELWPALCRLGDVFELAPSGTGTRITRTTTVTVRRRLAAVLYPALWLGLKSVHRFVFRNWQRSGRRLG
ncbi:hypothetical protein ACQP2X_05965 [Actinoplanes sp. CA-131856]